MHRHIPVDRHVKQANPSMYSLTIASPAHDGCRLQFLCRVHVIRMLCNEHPNDACHTERSAFFEYCGFAHPIGMTALKLANFSRMEQFSPYRRSSAVKGIKNAGAAVAPALRDEFTLRGEAPSRRALHGAAIQ